MYIICFLALMILNQNIILLSEAKPLLTNTNQLNSPRDFDNIVDWTGNSNDKTKTDKNENHNFEDTNNGGKLRLKQRSISTPSNTGAVDSTIDLEEIDKTILNVLPPLKDKKTKRGSEDIDEVNNLINDYADNMSGFGEKIGKLYKRMRNKISGKKSENCMNKIEENDPIKLYGMQNYYGNKLNFIPSFKRSVPLCLLNERHGSAYYSPSAAAPAFQPILMNESPSYIYPSFGDESARYEVHWMDPSANSPSYQRARRQVLLNDEIFSLMNSDEIEKKDELLKAQKELVNIVKSINTEFFIKNNLTFLPIIFNPEPNRNEDLVDDWSSEPVEFQDTDGRRHENQNEFSLDSVDHFTVVLMSNNTINLVIPVQKEQKKKSARHSENAFELLQEYLKQTFNFSDTAAVPRDDRTVVPGILVFPSNYTTSPKSSLDGSNIKSEKGTSRNNLPKYYYVNSETIGSAKSKRSLDSTDGRAKTALHDKREILEKEKRDASVQKDVEIDPVADKGTLGETSVTENSVVADKFKEQDAHLEKEIKEMIQNEQMIESSDIEEHSTTEAKVTAAPMELLSDAEVVPAVDLSNELDYSTETLMDSTESCTQDVETDSCPDIDIGECAETPCEETTPCEVQEESTGESKNKNVRNLSPANEIQSKVKENKPVNRKTDYLSRKSTEYFSDKKQESKYEKRRKKRFQRSRRDLKNVATSTTLNSKQEFKSTSAAEIEPSKVTLKVTSIPVLQGEEFENVNQVLFTAKHEEETDTAETHAGGRNHKTSTSLATVSSNCSSNTTDVPAAISEYTASNVMDENDECMTETLNRLLRDVSLVDKVQNILEGIKDAGYAIRQAVRKKSKRRARSFRDRNILSLKSRDKFSEIDKNDKENEKALNSILPQGINRKLFSVDTSVIEKDNSDGIKHIRGHPKRHNKRWKHSAKNWLEWLPNFEPFLAPNYQNYQL